MYLYPQPARRTRLGRTLLGKAGIVAARPPIVRVGPAAGAAAAGSTGHGLPAGYGAPKAQVAQGGVPSSVDKRRQPSFFTEIGPGSAAGGVSRGGFRASRRRRSLSGNYRYLSGITADQAAQTAMPQSAISSKAGFTQAVYNDIVQAASSGSFVGFNPGGCQGVSTGGNIKLAQTATGLALTGLSAGIAAYGVVAGTAAATAVAAAAAPFTLGVSAIIGLLPLFFAHHAAAVAKEQKIVCGAVPAATNYLQQIESAVQSGWSTPQQGIAALQSLQSDFAGIVAPIIKNNSSQCNAACVWVKELAAIVAYQTSLYQDMITAQSSAGPAPALTSAVASVANSTGLPPWALAAAAFGVLWTMF